MLFGVRGAGGWGECLLGTGPLTISRRACTCKHVESLNSAEGPGGRVAWLAAGVDSRPLSSHSP